MYVRCITTLRNNLYYSAISYIQLADEIFKTKKTEVKFLKITNFIKLTIKHLAKSNM